MKAQGDPNEDAGDIPETEEEDGPEPLSDEMPDAPQASPIPGSSGST